MIITPRAWPLLVALAVGEAAWAQAPQPESAGPTALYPVRVSLRLQGRGMKEEHWHQAFGEFSPPNPTTVVPVGKQAAEAYQRALHRLFSPGADGSAEATLELRIRENSYGRSSRFWLAHVIHEAVLRSAQGQELGRWTLSGDGIVDGLGERQLHAAFAEAAENAARDFDRKLEEAAGVRGWLEARGITPAERIRPGNVRPLPPQAGSESELRGTSGLFVETGVTWLWGTKTTREWPSDTPRSLSAAGLLLAAGWRGKFAFLRGHLQTFRALESVTSYGADLGGRLRPAADWDVLVGLGFQRLSVAWSATPLSSHDTASGMVPSLFAGLRYTGPAFSSFRLDVGLEVRAYAPQDLTVSELSSLRFRPSASASLVLALESVAGG